MMKSTAARKLSVRRGIDDWPSDPEHDDGDDWPSVFHRNLAAALDALG